MSSWKASAKRAASATGSSPRSSARLMILSSTSVKLRTYFTPVAARPQVADHHVPDHVAAGVAEVGEVVDGRAAGVEADRPGLAGWSARASRRSGCRAAGWASRRFRSVEQALHQRPQVHGQQRGPAAPSRPARASGRRAGRRRAAPARRRPAASRAPDGAHHRRVVGAARGPGPAAPRRPAARRGRAGRPAGWCRRAAPPCGPARSGRPSPAPRRSARRAPAPAGSRGPGRRRRPPGRPGRCGVREASGVLRVGRQLPEQPAAEQRRPARAKTGERASSGDSRRGGGGGLAAAARRAGGSLIARSGPAAPPRGRRSPRRGRRTPSPRRWWP